MNGFHHALDTFLRWPVPQARLAIRCARLLQFSADAGDVPHGSWYLLVQWLLNRFSIGSLIEKVIAAMVAQPRKTPTTARLADPAELLTPKEYAKAAKVSVSWLAKARKRGDGPPFVRFGRSVRYFPPGIPE